MKNSNTRRLGFTLIELLVVVLIIGILAAVALPQYQRVVDKARYMQAVRTVESIFKATETFYLANGTYPLDFASLDLSLPGATSTGTNTSGQVVEISADNIARCVLTTDYSASQGVHVVCQAKNLEPMYGIWFSSKQRYCIANTSTKAEDFCSWITGIQTPSNWGVWKLYRFP